MAAKQAMKENLQCTSKYGLLRISQDICHVRMTDIEDFLTIYGHSDNLLNNKYIYLSYIFITLSFEVFTLTSSPLGFVQIYPVQVLLHSITF